MSIKSTVSIICFRRSDRCFPYRRPSQIPNLLRAPLCFFLFKFISIAFYVILYHKQRTRIEGAFSVRLRPDLYSIAQFIPPTILNCSTDVEVVIVFKSFRY